MSSDVTPHLVLTRKWRPERFDELVGQEHVTRGLVNALKTGRLAHAYLFTGIRGVGKTSAARILAACLNCVEGPTPKPCGRCPACVEVRQGCALDVVEIDGATYRKLDDARAIIENLAYRPARDRFKVYIIDEAHQLTDQAFNALLKTLEEPPAHVRFVLATTEPQKMPETILSRLQRYDFRRIPIGAVVGRLSDLAAREGAQVEPAALQLLAHEAGGSMRDAERMLETVLAAAGDAVSEQAAAETLGVASRNSVMALTRAILERDAPAALRHLREECRRGVDFATLGRALLETIRSLAMARLGAALAEELLEGLPDQEMAELKELSGRASGRDLMRLFKLLADAQEQILRSPYADLLLEMAVLRMASLAPVMDAEELLKAVRDAARAQAVAPPRGEGGSGGGHARQAAAGGTAPGDRAGPPKQAAAPEQGGPAAARQSAGAAAGDCASQGGAAATASRLPSETSGEEGPPGLRAFIRTQRAALAGFMEHGARLELVGDTLRIVPRNDIYVRYLADNRGVVADLASRFYGRPIGVELVVSRAPAHAAAGSGQPARQTEAAQAVASKQNASAAPPRQSRAGAAQASPAGNAGTTLGAAPGQTPLGAGPQAPEPRTAQERPARRRKPPAAPAQSPPVEALDPGNAAPAPSAASSQTGASASGQTDNGAQECLTDPTVRKLIHLLEARFVGMRRRRLKETPIADDSRVEGES